ncbi:MAG: hypothetical protein NUV98_00985 [Candidatus Roizmanbacteria bacterium]|nr:hypothetical protein [Candidatus Roizmanbacteria bacterium]
MRPEYPESLQSTEQKELINRRILVKIGSSSLVKDRKPDEAVNISTLESIARALSMHIDHGGEAIIVTSGAVASGKWLSKMRGLTHEEMSKQFYACIGQGILIQSWIDAFEKFDKIAGQILVTDRDINEILNLISEMTRAGTIPIINANDAIDVQELDALSISQDNDRLATHIAQQVECNATIYLTNVDGVLDANLECIRDGSLIDLTSVSAEKSAEGTGGMYSKVQMAQSLAAHNVHGVIAHVKNTQVIDQVANGDYATIHGTVFRANELSL